MSQHASPPVKAVLGPTNTGKTHYAIERLCAHSSGIMGFPLRLLAREVYDRVVAIKGASQVGLITGEERIMPADARWLLTTTESMPIDRDAAFVALDEAQLGVDRERGHVFTDRLLNARGREETLILGSASLKPIINTLLPECEMVTRPRFSRLSYAGPKKLSRLPPRAAIIAFSADDVYAIAELLRRHCGGAAIVMGSLSPRTRNAQVALYESGEVDYIVATDAIGMGLNMDIGHVAFASLSKFDGTRHRRLAVHEMAQIAGRAGRHHRDGTFGIALTGEMPPEFTQEEIDRIEDHRFAPNRWLYWRNSDLDFASPISLLDSLEAPPTEAELRPAPEADDHAVLKRLQLDWELMDLATGPGMTRRLWDVCGLPDFRGTGPEFHAGLVGRLFHHLVTGHGTIPVKMIADDVARLDNVQGAIPALAARLASIRTWTYVANRADWLEQPGQWAERTRDVEQRLSDALHNRLTERFVDRRMTRLARERDHLTGPGGFEISDDGQVLVLDERVGMLRGFSFQPDIGARTGERRKYLVEAERQLRRELVARARALVAASDAEFSTVMDHGAPVQLSWRGAPVATLKRGRGLLTPDVEPDPAIQRLEPSERQPVVARLKAYVAATIAERLRPLVMMADAAFAPQTLPEVRALLAPLAEAGGAIARAEVAVALAALTREQRAALRPLGILFGTLGLFNPLLLKPSAMQLRLALIAVRAGEAMPPVPMPGLGLLDRPPPDLARSALRAGFVQLGNQMLRLDLAERMARLLHDQRTGRVPFTPDLQLASSIGVGAETLTRLMRALGFVPHGAPAGGQWRWKGLRRPAANASRRRPQHTIRAA